MKEQSNVWVSVEKAAIKLNNACDKMWNTEGISRKVPENNIKEITKAQKELKIALEKHQPDKIDKVDCGIMFEFTHRMM